jgi:hypothetical protein
MGLLLALVLLACAPLSAQLHFGLRAGLPFGDVTETISGGGTALKTLPSRWTLGPMLELDLPAGLGLEVNALYRRVGYEQLSGDARQFTGGL